MRKFFRQCVKSSHQTRKFSHETRKLAEKTRKSLEKFKEIGGNHQKGVLFEYFSQGACANDAIRVYSLQPARIVRNEQFAVLSWRKVGFELRES